MKRRSRGPLRLTDQDPGRTGLAARVHLARIPLTQNRPLAGYAAAVILAAVAQLARFPLHPPTAVPFITYVPFIAMSAAFGGLGPGLLTTILCTLESCYFAASPGRSLLTSGPQNWLGPGLLSLSGVIMSVLFDKLGGAAGALAAANRELTVIHENAPVALLVVDQDLRVQKASDRAAQLAGRTAPETQGLRPGAAIGCLSALDDPGGCGEGTHCGECPIRLAVLDSAQNGTPHDSVEAWLPVPAEGRERPRCLAVSTAALNIDDSARVLVCAQDITDRKLAEMKLQGQHDRLRRQAELINLSHDAIILTGANRVIQSWNKGAEEMYGWTEAEALGQVAHLFLRTGSATLVAAIDDILARDGRWEGELVHIHRDGRRIVIESRQVLARDAAGVPTGIMEINRDVTERQRAQDELREAHRRTTSILKSLSDGFVTFDREGSCTSVNAAAAKMLLKPPEELLGKSLRELWPHVEESPFGAACLRAVAENVPVRMEAYYPEPFKAWFEVRCYPSPDGLALFFTDTTERKRAEQALRDSEERLRLAHQVARVGTFERNVQTGASRWTEELEKLYGLPPGGFPGHHEAFRSLVHPDDLPEVERMARESLTKREGEGEWRAVWPDGTAHWLAARWRVLPDEAGHPLRMLGACIDITERKRAEDAVRDTVRMLRTALTERTVLLKEVHHRVKNNLAVISSLLGMRADATENAEARQALEDSQQRVHSIALIHEHLYGNDRLDRVNFPEYAREIIDELHMTFANGLQRIAVDVDADPVELGVDRAVPCALILNELASNAFKYAFPDGRPGRLGLICREIAPDRVKLVVEDDGVGMPENFDWRQPSSLGLQIVQILAKQIDATINVAGGHGTRFELTFPGGRNIAPDPAQRAVQAATAS